MLNKNHRLADERSFKRIRSKGISLKGKFIIMKFVFLNNRLNSKFAISISKKVASHAVDRNKIKRQISHILEKLVESLKKSVEMNVIVRVIPEKFSDLNEEISLLLKQASLL